jgi:shikimate dehydrogenase
MIYIMPDAITSKKIYGLIGNPLVHSFSQNFFNQKFETEKIDAEYINFEIDDIKKLTDVIKDNANLQGLNVTIPYKEQVIPFLDEIDEDAKAIGAVNVIKFIRDKGELKLKGFNSDIIGFNNSIRDKITPNRKQALVLGTGGAAKAIFHGLKKLGVTPQYVSRHKSATTVTYEELTKAMVSASKIVVNTTPLGMYPHIDTCPDFPYRYLTKEHLCYDLIYNPDETLFMKKSKEHGAETKNGLEMLLLQAFASYEIWNR